MAARAVVKTFTCESCKGNFPIERDDQQAMEEAKELFPEQCLDDPARVCHECWIVMMCRAEKQGYCDGTWRTFLTPAERRRIERIQ